MPQYRSAGIIPHKRHTELRNDSGALAYEEMHTTQGFADVFSLLYHVAPPTTVLGMDEAICVRVDEWNCGTHRHHLFDSGDVAGSGSFFDSRRPILYNDDIVISVANPTISSDLLYRNAFCDELVCVGTGNGVLITPFGALEYGSGDLIVIPRGTTQEWKFHENSPQKMFILESRTTITPPARYLSRLGQFSLHSPISERDVRVPELQEPRLKGGSVRVRIKLGEEYVDYHLASHPFDLIGWDGYLYPYAINMRDFEPLTRRIHTMPDDQQIFETVGAAVCCLVPRMLEYHPGAIAAPPYHSSIDVDEVVINLGDKFMGWDRVSLGVMTFHPRGIAHGSKPGGYEGSIGMKEFDGTAIMVDSLQPLKLTAFAEKCDEPSYPSAWVENPAPEGAKKA